MVRSDQIPEQVWHTAMSTYHKIIKKRPGSAWQEAIAAALAAWPGLYTMGDTGLNTIEVIALPLDASETALTDANGV